MPPPPSHHLKRAAGLLVSGALLLLHASFGGDANGGGATNTTFTTSTTTSSETQTTTQTVRVDTFATRIVASDGIGGVLSDQTLPLPFADGAVQAVIAGAQAALLAGPPASLFVKGPTLVASVETLVDSSTTTVETGRTEIQTVTTETYVGPACAGIEDRDLPNTQTCAPCHPIAEPAAPAFGVPFCVLAGTVDFNANLDTHTTIQELQTTTETYLTTERYALRGSFLDHFVLYKVKGSKTAPKLTAFGPLTLTDALGSADYAVKKLPGLGLPADKNAEGRADDTTHVAQYALKRRKGAAKFAKIPNVATTNQCGALTLTLTKPESLLVPVAIDLTSPPTALDPLSHEVDHLLCYKAKAHTKLPKGTQVDAVDPSQTRRYDLKKVTRLCVPVTTAGTPVELKTQTAIPFVATAARHTAGHLVCYQAKAASKTIPQNGCGPLDPKSKGTKIVPKQPKHQKHLGVHLNGPLGSATIDTAKEVELCIPSIATLP